MAMTAVIAQSRHGNPERDRYVNLEHVSCGGLAARPPHGKTFMSNPLPLLVLGASAGGIRFFTDILSRLPKDFPAAVLVVLHLPKDGRSHLAEVLAAKSALPVVTAETDARLRPGCVSTAPPNRHLVLEGDQIILSSAATENAARPAIDATMRAAAVGYGPRVVACLGSGYLDDGVAGLEAVRDCGGVTIVQSPDDAEVGELPTNALEAMEPDHILPATEIGERLPAIIEALSMNASVDPPRRLVLEAAIAAGRRMRIETEDALGKPTPYACPDCGGNLWDIGKDGVERFRCHTGHAYTIQSLENAMSLEVSESLWSALRALRERADVLKRIADNAQPGMFRSRSEERAAEIAHHADVIEKLLLDAPNLGPFMQSG